MTVDNFSWVIQGVLAGSGQVFGDDWRYGPIAMETKGDLDSICDEGIRAVVSLTTIPLEREALTKCDIHYLHLPVMDMQAPTLEAIERFVEFVNSSRKDERPVLVHCGAGLGRTGTAIACYLVSEGATGPEALEKVRSMRPGSVETIEQEALIHRYHRYLNQKPNPDLSNPNPS